MVVESPGKDAIAGPSALDLTFQAALTLRRRGDTPRADALCEELLRVDPRHFDAYHLRGLIALGRGDFERGIELIERSLAINPAQPLAHSNLGNALLNRGEPQRALDCFDQALRFKADLPVAHYNRANALQELGLFEQALEGYDAALSLDAAHAKALNNRGLVLRSLGRLEEAVASFAAASERDPQFSAPLENHVAILLQQDRPLEALAICERLLKISPGDSAALCARGNAQLALGSFAEAAESYSAALQFDPECLEALINRSVALQRLKRFECALGDCDRALKIRPDSVRALCNSGNVLLSLHRFVPALACYEHARKLAPEDCDALQGVAAALLKLDRHEEADRALAAVLDRQPDHRLALGHLFNLRMQRCDWRDYSDLAPRALASMRRTRQFVNPLSLLLHDDPDVSLSCTSAYFMEQFPSMPDPAVVVGSASGRDLSRIRVAYVSADFTDHPVSHLLVGVLERHDRERFEIIGVSLRQRGSGAFEHRVHEAFDRCIDASELSEQAIAECLRENRVDIGVDLMGITEGARPGIFAARPAPVQVSYLGYAGTLGAPFIDYLVADPVVIPAGAERWYSEQIIRLPHCYLPTDDRRAVAAPPTRVEAGLPEQAFVFCAFTQAHKITPEMFAIWMSVLRQTPGGVLWLRDMGNTVRDHLLREAECLGVTRERLVFAPRVALTAEHVGRHALADLYLDTLPYNAHSTTCDALWAGVPVLTCAGNCFAGRVAASALTAAGLPELVTPSLKEYERCAVHFARERDRLRALRERWALRRRQSPLFDTARYAGHLEAAFERMHERALRGEPAAAFTLEPSPVTS